MKRIKFLLFSVAIALLTLMAYIGAASACVRWNYEPEVPQSLRKF